jgi:hypothetical protein
MSKFSVLVFGLFFASTLNAQLNEFGNGPKDRILDISVKKYGPYLGIQRGKYTVLELGGEMIWKEIRFKKPTAQAVNAGFNYNFRYNVLGFDAGYWIRPHRFGLTYGAVVVHRTDFTYNKLGIAPVIGYKIWMLHLRVGYYVLPNPSQFETNTLFISLRAGIISDRDVDIEWNGFRRDKKKK